MPIPFLDALEITSPQQVATVTTPVGDVGIYVSATNPNSDLSASIGSLCFAKTGTVWRKASNDGGNQGWLNLSPPNAPSGQNYFVTVNDAGVLAATYFQESSITYGVLNQATSDRTVNMGSNSLNFTNVWSGRFTALFNYIWTVPFLSAETQALVVRNTTPSPTSGGVLSLASINNVNNHVSLKAPTTVTSNYSITFPAAPPANATDGFLKVSTSGIGSWVAPPGGADTSLTTGQLLTATETRSADFGGYSLSLVNVLGYSLDAETGDVFNDAGQVLLWNANRDVTLPGYAAGAKDVSYPYTKALGVDSDGKIVTATPPQLASITFGVLPFATSNRVANFMGYVLQLQNIGTGYISSSGQFKFLLADEYHSTPKVKIANSNGTAGGVLSLLGTASNYVDLEAPPTVTTSYKIQFPPIPPTGSDGFLKVEADGTSAWVSPSGTAVSNITTGNIGSAIDNRTCDFAGFDLVLNNIDSLAVVADSGGFVSSAGEVLAYTPNRDLYLTGYAGGVKDAAIVKSLGLDNTGKLVTADPVTGGGGVDVMSYASGVVTGTHISQGWIDVPGLAANPQKLTLIVNGTAWLESELIAGNGANLSVNDRVSWAGTVLQTESRLVDGHTYQIWWRA